MTTNNKSNKKTARLRNWLKIMKKRIMKLTDWMQATLA